jgi:hypothetical protein
MVNEVNMAREDNWVNDSAKSDWTVIIGRVSMTRTKPEMRWAYKGSRVLELSLLNILGSRPSRDMANKARLIQIILESIVVKTATIAPMEIRPLAHGDSKASYKVK